MDCDELGSDGVYFPSRSAGYQSNKHFAAWPDWKASGTGWPDPPIPAMEVTGSMVAMEDMSIREVAIDWGTDPGIITAATMEDMVLMILAMPSRPPW